MKNPVYFLAIILLLITGSCDKTRDSKKEILLMNQVIMHVNSDDDNKYMGFSIFPYPADLPTNWVSPSAYKDGEVYYRITVLSKPDDRLVYYQIGFQWEEECNGSSLKEKFPHRDMIPITSPGVYTANQSLASFWEPECQAENPINWTVPMDRILVVLMDENFNPIDDRWGYGYDIENIDGYFPMEVHVQVVVVPEGGEFSGWVNYEL